MEQFNPQTDEWIHISSFVYADGTHSPPALLRDEPEMNYTDPAIRSTGLALMTVGLLLMVLSVIWVFWHRNHSVVVAAQPAFLYSLCFGAAMVVLAIWVTSYDESFGWTEEMLSKSCVAGVWVDSLGHMITFSALFTKVWVWLGASAPLPFPLSKPNSRLCLRPLSALAGESMHAVQDDAGRSVASNVAKCDIIPTGDCSFVGLDCSG